MKNPPATMRNGLYEYALKPGQPVPTEHVVKAVKITPALAQDWLDRYADPLKRHIRPDKVGNYADKMTAGDWLEMSKHNIEFIANGVGTTLSDGHHRLKAITVSGVSLWLEVHFGAPPASRRAEGVRLARSAGDMLRMEGCITYQAEIGAGVRIALLAEQTGGTDIRWRKSTVHIPDSEDITLAWLDDSHLWNGVAAFTKGVSTGWPVGMAQASVTAFVFLVEKKYPTEGFAFIKDVVNGGGPIDGRGRTVLAIFNQMLHIRPKTVPMSKRSGTALEWTRFTLAVLVRAFNAHRAHAHNFQRPEWETTNPFMLDKVR
jgi:hypothetical protein